MSTQRIGQGDRKVIERLCTRLTKTFEQFAKEEGALTPAGLRYVDALMGCHNFYKQIILDLEERTGSPMIHRFAISTLFEAFEIKTE